MRSAAFLTAVTALAMIVAVPSARAAAIADLHFLAGEWRGPMWGGVFEAYYTTPEGGRVLSHSRLLRGEKVAFHEFEVFHTVDGVPTLQPYPGGKPATALRLTKVEAEERRATFENPDKDYPTRIVYHRVADDRLVITLDDPHGGGEKREVFDLRRAPAP